MHGLSSNLNTQQEFHLKCWTERATSTRSLAVKRFRLQILFTTVFKANMPGNEFSLVSFLLPENGVLATREQLSPHPTPQPNEFNHTVKALEKQNYLN